MKKILIPLLVGIALISVLYVLFGDLEIYFESLLRQTKDNPALFALISFSALSADIVLPVPSSIIMFLNGLVLGIIRGAALSLMAVLVSALVGYYLGHLAARGLKKSPDEKAISIINTYGSVGIILTRGIPILSESVCFAAGYLGMNFRHYALLNFIGYLPICFIYAYFGSLGQGQYLFFIAFGSSILVSLLLWLFGRKLLESPKAISP